MANQIITLILTIIMATIQSIYYMPPGANSFYFANAQNNGLNVLNQADLAHQILPFQSGYGNNATQYFAKALNTDPVTLTLHSNVGYGPLLYLCDINQNIINGATTFLNTAPALKNLTQVVPGNNWVDPFSLIPYVLYTTLWNFSFSDLASFIIPGTPSSIYYFLLYVYNGTTYDTIFSEPIIIFNYQTDYWGNQANLKNTLLFQ